jgi:hypothetical protein
VVAVAAAEAAKVLAVLAVMAAAEQVQIPEQTTVEQELLIPAAVAAVAVAMQTVVH